MKKIIFGLSILGTVLFTQSCNEDDFLNTSPTETVSTPTSIQKLNGVYGNLFLAGTGGTSAHEDYGQKGVDLMTDLIQSDVALQRNVYNRYRNTANYAATSDYTANENYIPWRYYYKIVYGANDIMNDFNYDHSSLNDSDKKIFGQALGLRAYSYFYLLQLFTKEFDASVKGVPLVTSIQEQESKMATQAEVYNLIINDLTTAEVLLQGFTRTNKVNIDQNVVRGLLAYTYAAMGNNAKAAEYSKLLVESSYPKTTTAQLTGGFNAISTPSWIWGADLQLDMQLNLVSWWGQMDYFTYSYQSVGDYKTIDDNLRLSISNDDVRKNQFEQIIAGFWFGSRKFYEPKRQHQGARYVETDYIFMRVDEFHLLYAESLAKSGNLSTAKTVLKSFLDNRLTDTSYIDALTQTQFLDEVYKQTRIELWAEGKSYLSMKRNKKDVIRAQNHDAHKGLTIPFSDDRLTFKIPQAEVINNPNL